MKTKSKIIFFLSVLFTVAGLPGCSYLDVVPPETEDIKDMMKNEEAVLAFVYSCYSNLQWGFSDPIDYRTYESGTDEFVLPQLWNRSGQVSSWDQLSATYTADWGVWHPWNVQYDGIGYCNMFLDLLVKLNPNISDEKKAYYRAEVKAVKAFYYSRLLERYGPVPLVDTYPEMGLPVSSIPGRSHYDYCVDYVVGLLDEAIAVLPPVVATADLGRVNSTICKALKARVLLTAASPLWNGSFPYKGWQNARFETPGYGRELVSSHYDVKKWDRALAACEDALNSALGEGERELMDVETAELIRKNEKVPYPTIPGVDPNTEEGKEFLSRVVLMRYVMTSIETEGNRERVWGSKFAVENIYATLPHNM
ncbi:MAG: RagB/SusD family nutrient uptake outer membrane protein, partial [Bacteroidales bacterium]